MISWFTIGTYSVYMFHLTESRPTRDEITLYPNLGRGLVDTIKCLHLAGGVIINDIDGVAVRCPKVNNTYHATTANQLSSLLQGYADSQLQDIAKRSQASGELISRYLDTALNQHP